MESLVIPIELPFAGDERKYYSAYKYTYQHQGPCQKIENSLHGEFFSSFFSIPFSTRKIFPYREVSKLCKLESQKFVHNFQSKMPFRAQPLDRLHEKFSCRKFSKRLAWSLIVHHFTDLWSSRAEFRSIKGKVSFEVDVERMHIHWSFQSGLFCMDFWKLFTSDKRITTSFSEEIVSNRFENPTLSLREKSCP